MRSASRPPSPPSGGTRQPSAAPGSHSCVATSRTVSTPRTPRRNASTPTNLYTSALDVLELYLRNPPEASTEATQKLAGLGSGHPRIPYDNKYAAKELQSLMNLKPVILDLQGSFEVKPPAPTLDLSNVQLTGQSWPKIDFAWLGARFFPGIDLRGANLMGSIWGESFLEGAHFQCANLNGANLRGARLVNADLRGADLNGTDFTGAKLDGVMLDGATGWQEAKGLPENMRPEPGVSRVAAGPHNCLDKMPSTTSGD
jgi:Pentapeptide repeats (8 copies)